MSNYDHFSGLWRASAMEKVPYTEDFPECMLVLPEFYDGAIAHGKATCITTTVTWTNEYEAILDIEDNGVGIKNRERLLSWAAPSSMDNYHRNGHGHKKAITKLAPEYSTAKWAIEYRKPGQNVVSIASPFLGAVTKITEDEDNVKRTFLMPSGTRTSIRFNTSVLGRIGTPQQLLAAFKEIVQTRYSEKTLRDVQFVFHIRGLNEVYATLDSHERGRELHSFRWYVEKGVRDGSIKCICNDTEYISAGAAWKLSRYHIEVKGTSSFDLKKEFPVYGAKNQQTQRIFISLEGRMIEPAKFHEFTNRKAAQNCHNGYLTFVDFVSSDMAKKPEPSTTKVSMYGENPIYKEFVKDLQSILNNTNTSDEDAGSVESTSLEPSSSMEAIPVQPTQAPLSNPNRNCVANIEAILGVKFKLIDGVLNIKENEDSTVWRPLSEYTIVRRT
jgi:hypothetical protein